MQPASGYCQNAFGSRTAALLPEVIVPWSCNLFLYLSSAVIISSLLLCCCRYLYLGTYEKEQDAARVWDLAALKSRGTSAHTNFPVDTYLDRHNEIMPLTKVHTTLDAAQWLLLWLLLKCGTFIACTALTPPVAALPCALFISQSQ
jgi:hypothetical protein